MLVEASRPGEARGLLLSQYVAIRCARIADRQGLQADGRTRKHLPVEIHVAMVVTMA